MTTSADFTTRARTEMFSIFQAYQALERRVTDLSDEVTANGGATGIYGAAGVDWPDQGDQDKFIYTDMVAAFSALTSLVGEPTTAQKQAIIKTRRE